MNIFEEIRCACARVAEISRFVKINHDQIAPFGRALIIGKGPVPELDTDHHYLHRGADTAAFLLVLDSINFGSGYFPHLRKLPGCSGYFTVATHLKRWFESEGVPPAKRLTALTAEHCAEIFNQEIANSPAMELMAGFARALNDLGTCLQDQFAGAYTSLIEAAGGSARKLVDILAGMPMFEDVSDYAGQRVPFYKRAQLTAADLALALPETPWGQFDDLDQLTIFADNLVPHVLHVDHVLQYDPGLALTISTGELLTPGSQAEIEIRACALHAVERIKGHLTGEGHAVTSQELDYLLWNRGQRKFYKAFARHRARTVYY